MTIICRSHKTFFLELCSLITTSLIKGWLTPVNLTPVDAWPQHDVCKLMLEQTAKLRDISYCTSHLKTESCGWLFMSATMAAVRADCPLQMWRQKYTLVLNPACKRFAHTFWASRQNSDSALLQYWTSRVIELAKNIDLDKVVETFNNKNSRCFEIQQQLDMRQQSPRGILSYSPSL